MCIGTAQQRQPVQLTCPDCGGVLFEFNDRHPLRYRCHTGHAFSLPSLPCTQEEVTDAALWTRLQEKESILRRLAQLKAPGASEQLSDMLREADELAAVCAMLRKLTERAPSPGSLDAPS